MYVMHHAFRRDLRNFAAAVENTPVSETAVWVALHERWLRFAEVLHHHHAVEDENLWPVLTRYAEAAGSTEDLTMLEDMEAEHAVIDPALQAVERRVRRDAATTPVPTTATPSTSGWPRPRESLQVHLAHEEGQALPMLQRTLTVEENAAFEAAAGKGYPLRLVPFLLCWAFDGLPDEARRRILDHGPSRLRPLHRLLKGRFERREREAFRYV